MTTVQVYEGSTLIGTFPDHESATWFIYGEYSAEEADILRVHVVEVDAQEGQALNVDEKHT
jgi:hypothetical protein